MTIRKAGSAVGDCCSSGSDNHVADAMTFSTQHRTRQTEILDAGTYACEEMRGNLLDLRRYNKWLGGSRLILRTVASLFNSGCPSRSISALDVATGSADILHALVRWGSRQGLTLLPVGMDLNADVLHEARRVHRVRNPSLRLVQADARRLPYADRSIDVVICATFLHHLEDRDAVETLREMKRVARLGIVVVDLKRTRMAWGLLWLLTRLTTMNRLTRNDGTVSIEQSFTRDELNGLAEKAGLAGARVRDAGPVRIVLSYAHSGTGESAAS